MPNNYNPKIGKMNINLNKTRDIGNPYNKVNGCHICAKEHRHFAGLHFARKHDGETILCPSCHKIHKIGFKSNDVNYVFLGTSSFHLAHAHNVEFFDCVMIETICGGKIKDLLKIYNKCIQPFSTKKFCIILSVGLNDFKKQSLAELKASLKDFQSIIEKNSLHSVYFGSLLRAPTLMYEYKNSREKCILNKSKLEKFDLLNQYILSLSTPSFDLKRFGYSLKKGGVFRLKPRRWREYKAKDNRSLANCLHLNNAFQRIALISVLNQIYFQLNGKVVCK
jgi:hypothetical protein